MKTYTMDSTLSYIVATVMTKSVRAGDDEHGQLIWAGLQLIMSCNNAISGKMCSLASAIERIKQQARNPQEDDFLFLVRTLCPFSYTNSSWTSVIW